MWAVLPIKDLASANQRLADVLSPLERRGFFRAMVEDVLATLSAVAALDGIVVVSRDPEAASLAQSYRARLMEEDENRGQTAAIAAAAATLAAEGVDSLITVPGDVPLATPTEIDRVLALHGAAPSMTIVPARDERGSNCVACSPPDAIPFRFGHDSFFLHLEAARRRGISPRVLDLPGLGLDIDTPADLEFFLDRPGSTHAYHYLKASGIATRLQRRGRGVSLGEARS